MDLEWDLQSLKPNRDHVFMSALKPDMMNQPKRSLKETSSNPDASLGTLDASREER